MKLTEHLARQKKDARYVEAERELRPLLDLANDILRLRLEKGWTQAELARQMGTRQANVSRVEAGLANPTADFLQRLARALDTELVIRLKSEDAEPVQIDALHDEQQVAQQRTATGDAVISVVVLGVHHPPTETAPCRFPFSFNNQESDTRILEKVH
jgi:transcriptional regulator with XRE-family HTH domain